MVFNITTVDICGTAGINRPTVVVIFLSDAAVGGQAEVGRSAGLAAVAVENNNALIREIFSNCGTGSEVLWISRYSPPVASAMDCASRLY